MLNQLTRLGSPYSILPTKLNMKFFVSGPEVTLETSQQISRAPTKAVKNMGSEVQ